MRIEQHLLLSAVVSGLLYIIFKSWAVSLASLVSGIMIDADHIIDYLRENEWTFRRRNFIRFFYKEEHRKITLFFHGWEILIVLCGILILSNYNPWIVGTCVGYGHHIISDYLYSKTGIGTYSLLWRWKKGFDSHMLFPRGRGYDPWSRMK